MHTHLYIITGTSRGLGLAMAEQLLSQDHQLLCIARRNTPSLNQRAAELGCKLTQWTLDLATPQPAAIKLEHWLESFNQQQFETVTLVNNAGVIPPLVPLCAATNEDTAHALRVGLEAPMLLTTAFLRATMTFQGPRKVLNISSGLGRHPMASQAAYCAAKAGMDHFTRCLALDEAMHVNGAKVCALAPGVIDTDMQVQLRNAPKNDFPDQAVFANLKNTGQLTAAQDAAKRVLAWLNRPDFGANPVADVRDA